MYHGISAMLWVFRTCVFSPCFTAPNRLTTPQAQTRVAFLRTNTVRGISSFCRINDLCLAHVSPFRDLRLRGCGAQRLERYLFRLPQPRLRCAHRRRDSLRGSIAVWHYVDRVLNSLMASPPLEKASPQPLCDSNRGLGAFPRWWYNRAQPSSLPIPAGRVRAV